jgi:outer membrane lipoprotein-sorting protein
MQCHRLAVALASVAVIAAAGRPVAAQTLPVEMVVSPPRHLSDYNAMAGSNASAALTPPPLPAAFQPIGLSARPSSRLPREAARAEAVTKPEGPGSTARTDPQQAVAETPAKPAVQDKVVAAETPVETAPAFPPARPTRVPAATAEAAPAEPITVAEAAATAAAKRREPLSDEEVVARANAYFNGLNTLVADFTQFGGDGRRIGGTLYLQRPGKARFDYDTPSTLEVIADGSSVAVRDTKLATQDLYSISQTPLKFLLRDRVNLGQDIKITNIARDAESAQISLEDRSTLGGTSRITLYFDPEVKNLTQWRIIDSQGFQTVVMLNGIERGRRVDPSLFVIQYDRAITTDTFR